MFVIQIAGVKKLILFADAEDRSTNYISLDVNYFVSQTFLKREGQRPIALDFDPAEDRVYWSDANFGGIFSAFSNRTSVKMLFYCNVKSPYGLAMLDEIFIGLMQERKGLKLVGLMEKAEEC